MKTLLQNKGKLCALSILVFLAFALVSCQKEVTANSKQNAAVNQQNGNATSHIWQYLVGEEPTIEGPDKTISDAGDTMIIAGSGIFHAATGEINGEGWYMHINPKLHSSDKGTWKAQKLISFANWGMAAPPLPSNFYGGLAVINIHLYPASGKAGTDATLYIYCVIPGAHPPPDTDEGIKLLINNTRYFNDQVFGQTLFIAQ